MTKFEPDYVVCPGEILEETLQCRDIKKKDFASQIGHSAKMVSEIIAGKAPITAETAIQFEKRLGINASLWMNLEAAYRLKLARKK